MDSLEVKPTTEKAPGRSKQEILDDLAQLQYQRGLENTRISKIYNSLSAQDREKADKQLQTIYSDPSTAQKSIKKLAHEQGSKSIWSAVESSYLVNERINELEKEGEQYKEETIKEITDLVNYLYPRLDYEEVFKQMKEESKKYEGQVFEPDYLFDIFELWRNYDSIRRGVLNKRTFFDLEDKKERLQGLRTELEEKKLLFEGDESRHREAEENSEIGTLECLENIQTYKDDLKKDQELSAIYRGFRLDNWQMSNTLSTLSEMLNRDLIRNGLDEFEELDFNSDYIAALANFLNTCWQNYKDEVSIIKDDEDDNRIRNLDKRERVNNLLITGLEVSTGYQLIITAEELRETLIDKFPVFFLERLKVIDFIPKEEKSPNDPDAFIGGRHFLEGNDPLSLESRIEIYLPFETDSTDFDVKKEYLKKELLSIIFHEVGHNIHQVIVLGELSRWDNIIKYDTTAVTAYVERSRNKDEATGKREDFSETVSLFLTNPGYLFQLSSRRYYFMRELFASYLPVDQFESYQRKIDQQASEEIEQGKRAITFLYDLAKEAAEKALEGMK